MGKEGSQKINRSQLHGKGGHSRQRGDIMQRRNANLFADMTQCLERAEIWGMHEVVREDAGELPQGQAPA